MDDSSQLIENERFWFINSLVTVKASTSTTGGSFSLVHQIAPPGFATPYHRHPYYDESYYILDGEITSFKDDVRAVLKAGDFIFLPRGIAHGFRVDSPTPASMLLVFVPGDDFVSFVREMGEPAAEAILPMPTPPNVPKLLALSEKYGSTILGPLPH